MHPMLNIAIQAARNASKVILQYVDRMDMVEVQDKNTNDLVTQVDRQSEECIIEHIRKSYPDHAILAEESGQSDGKDDYCWIIDPIDGTRNFAHGVPHYAISIALKYKDRLEIGVVYDPIKQELFAASRGEGATLNDRKIRVRQNKKLENSLIATGFPFKNPEQIKSYLNIFEKVFSHCGGMRRAGSAALDMAYVAAGRFDGYWEANVSPWDIAAGALLVTEAGGAVSDYHDRKAYLDNGTVICGNTRIQKMLQTLIAQSNKEA
ncbi:MAG: inositol monophosphatase [Gammaproteobacteria bacterium]|nr:inositol monophosphatase [Gammaproteobacteria bacterium]MCH9744160.1 inositol monophosphatase [Gammaproteobacteria bacterium]